MIAKHAHELLTSRFKRMDWTLALTGEFGIGRRMVGVGPFLTDGPVRRVSVAYSPQQEPALRFCIAINFNCRHLVGHHETLNGALDGIALHALYVSVDVAAAGFKYPSIGPAIGFITAAELILIATQSASEEAAARARNAIKASQPEQP
jgi:hypothetical protein